jgi:UDP-N-acetylmuramoyl-tripeptide--D-alanyl-D-alanine ligase
MLTLGTILEALSGQEIHTTHHVITDAAVDSRLIIPGALFVAVAGERADGHSYVRSAFERGAAVALVAQDMGEEFEVLDLRGVVADLNTLDIPIPICLRVENTIEALQKIAAFWRTKLSLRVIGITGSVGKSTTKELIAEVLGQRYRTVKNPGNLNNEIGLPLSILRITEAHQCAILEMGFYVPGEIKLLAEIASPQVGVITNISQVHLERAGTMEAIVAGKTELVESLPEGPEGTAILNYDELPVRNMAEKTAASVFYYGLSPEADLWASEVESLGLEGIRFVLHYRGESLHVRVPMLGRHSVHTALRAAAVGVVEKLTWQEIIHGLQSSHTQLRLVAVNGPGGSLILDDTYNSAPASVMAALNLLAELDGRKVAILGDMLELGDFEERGHRMVGVRAAAVVDELIAVGKLGLWIKEEAVLAGLPEPRTTWLEKTEEAISYLDGRIGTGDVVLVKGSRGMAMERIVSALEEAV